MIDFYTWATSNGRKISIALEELALPYRVHPVNIYQNEQHRPEFLALNPNGKIPVIVDAAGPDGQPITVFESGAILIYLAEKCRQLLPEEPRGRMATLQWLMWQMGGVGPMLGQAHHFLKFAPEPVPYAIARYQKETHHYYNVLNQRLGAVPYVAGNEYTIADIATYPWIARHEWHQVDLADYPQVQDWFTRIGARPAVQKGMALLNA